MYLAEVKSKWSFQRSRIETAQHLANALVHDEVVRTPLVSQQVALEQIEARLNVSTEPPVHQSQQQPNMPLRCTVVTTFNGTLRVNNTSMQNRLLGAASVAPAKGIKGSPSSRGAASATGMRIASCRSENPACTVNQSADLASSPWNTSGRPSMRASTPLRFAPPLPRPPPW